MIQRHGIIGAVERAVNRSSETAGFTALHEMGLGDFAFEAVVIRYPTLFTPEAVERSRTRLVRRVLSPDEAIPDPALNAD